MVASQPSAPGHLDDAGDGPDVDYEGVGGEGGDEEGGGIDAEDIASMNVDGGVELDEVDSDVVGEADEVEVAAPKKKTKKKRIEPAHFTVRKEDAEEL